MCRGVLPKWPSCVLRRCKNYGSKVNKNEGITYHTFLSDDLTRLIWVSMVQAERSEYDWMSTKKDDDDVNSIRRFEVEENRVRKFTYIDSFIQTKLIKAS